MGVVYAAVIISGLAAGSFANVMIYRIPAGKSVVYPPSACTSCASRLTVTELIPVVSYILLKGKCGHCGANIPPRYLLVELITAAVFAAIFHRYGLSLPFFMFAFLMTILIAVFFIDIDHRIIPNGLVITALTAGAAVFAINCFKPIVEAYGDAKWWTPIAGLIPGTGFLLLIAAAGMLLYKTDDAMGMGDVKLMAPIGMFVGWKLCIAALFISVVLGGIYSAILMVLRFKKRKDTIAFGPFIVIGTFIAIMWGQDLLSLYLGR